MVSASTSPGSVNELVLSLRAAFGAASYAPPMLPVVALRLHELTRQKEPRYADILALLEEDPLIAARVLRIAQSPNYAGRVNITSLEQALIRLGIERLTDIFLEVALTMKVFRVPGFETQINRLRRHSAATARIARVLCREVCLDEGLGFLCGLLHDVGIVAALVLVAGGPRGRGPLPLIQVWSAILELHEEAAGIVCHSWHLSPILTEVVSRHHMPADAPLATVIAIADWMAAALGFPEDEAQIPAQVESNPPLAALDQLGLEHDLERLFRIARRQLEGLE